MEKYENLGLVGEGSYGIVMKCRHKATGTLVAIKKFLENEDDRIVRKIAKREIKMLKELRHENLVNLIDLFRRKKKLFLVFEFVDYTLLDDLEKHPAGLEYNYAKKILFQVLRGIEFCHNKDVIHRDIKPENILVSKSGIVKLCDFGFARPLNGQSNSFTDYVATRWYRAPELLVGDTKYGKPVDIWAIGCLTSEMFSGDPLFPGDSDIDQLFLIVKCIGHICPKHIEMFKKNPLFKGLKIPKNSSRHSIEKRYPKMIKEIINFIKKCLDPTPDCRPTCSQLLLFDIFPESFSESLITEIKTKVQKERDKNILLKNSLNSETSISNIESPTNKILTTKSPTNSKSNSQKSFSNINSKIKINENNQIFKNINIKNNVIKNVQNFNNQENEIISDKTIIFDEEAWEDVRPLTSRKERVASRVGRYPRNDLLVEPDNDNESSVNLVMDLTERSDINDITNLAHIETPYSKVVINNLNQIPNYIKEEISMKLNSSPSFSESPSQDDNNNKVIKLTPASFISKRISEIIKLSNERSPSIEANFISSSPIPNEICQTPIYSKKNISLINNNSTNGITALQSKTSVNTFNSRIQQSNNNVPFCNYQFKQNINNVQKRNLGFASDKTVNSHFPNIGKESKFMRNNMLFRGVSPPNKSFMIPNNSNVFKSPHQISKEKSGFYNTQNKKRVLLTNKSNPIIYDNVSLPELKGAEMQINRNHTYNQNPKYKYIIPTSNVSHDESQSNISHIENITTEEP